MLSRQLHGPDMVRDTGDGGVSLTDMLLVLEVSWIYRMITETMAVIIPVVPPLPHKQNGVAWLES